MMKKGLNTLEQLVKDKTEEFIVDLFSSYVVITEKIDAARITFQVKDGRLTIWRKDERYPISIVDRTLMQYYEKAIDHITSVIDYAVIPENYRFGCYYFSSLTPNKTQYKRMPKNHLVLTDVRITDQEGEKIKDNGETIRKWATELRIEPAPIIFEGHLTDKQKERVLDYIKLTPEELLERYGSQTFSEFLIKTLNPNVNSSFLQEDGLFRSESIIFRFRTKKGETYVAKTVDPLIARNSELNEEIPESTVPSDLYSIALMDVYAYIIENGLEYKLKERTPEFRYLELICLLFNDFVEENMERYSRVDFSEPKFLRNQDFDLNKRFIDNKRTLELISMDRSYEQLFKIMLAALRKKRRRTYGLLTQAMVNQINLVIDEIREMVEVPLSEGMLDFSTFRIFREEPSDRSVSSLIDVGADSYEDEPKKPTATVVVLKPMIITKQIERKIKELSEFDRVFVICVPNESCPLSVETMERQINAYVSAKKDANDCCFLHDEQEIKTKLEEIMSEHDIQTICTSTDCMQWLKTCIDQEIGDIGYHEDGEKAIEYISKDDFSRFKSLCPTYINSMYMSLQNDLEKTQKIEYQT